MRPKKKFDIKGVVTGALYSNYQKERIERIAKKIGLKVISPLWHMNQEKYMREVIKSGFKFIIVSVAAEGLDKNWLGKIVTEKDIDRLVEINKKIGINIAFEGGEAETLMIDGPIFKRKVVIKKAEITMENECTGIYKIEEAELE